MEKLELIAAVGKHNELGYKNDLLWHIKEDMKAFKKITMNKTNDDYIVVGGGQIYNLFINDVNIMYLTHINQENIFADTFFPMFNEEDFKKELLMEGSNDKLSYKQYKYIRR